MRNWNWRGMRAVIAKDLAQVKQNTMVWLPMIILPVILQVLMPLGMILAPQLAGEAAVDMGEIEPLLKMLPASLVAGMEEFSPEALWVVLSSSYLFAPFFLIVPIMVSSILAADSIVGEKERKTMEGLLYTPLTDSELYVAKALVAVIPALSISLGSFILYTLVVNIAGYPVVGRIFFPTAIWWPLVFWLAPAVSVAGLGVTVLISSKAKTFMQAQQLGGVLVLPIVGWMVAQSAGVFFMGQSLMMRYPETGKSTAENFLMLMREDGLYTPLEAELLDLCLVLHAEHGGGNNSAFTTHVVTSSFTDTYAAIAAATLSLKGPRHGGANLRVMEQMREIKEHVEHWNDEDEVAAYLTRILNKEAGDGTGLIYGLGHAVYTLSDPRTGILRDKARALARAKGRDEEMALYETIERIGPALFNRNRAKPRDLCANVDFFSGFVYDMLNIPVDLYTPLFAISRVVGWCAHRIEELLNGGPIIRPAYKAVFEQRPYTPLSERNGA